MVVPLRFHIWALFVVGFNLQLIDDLEHLSMYLLAASVSPLEMCLRLSPFSFLWDSGAGNQTRPSGFLLLGKLSTHLHPVCITLLSYLVVFIFLLFYLFWEPVLGSGQWLFVSNLFSLPIFKSVSLPHLSVCMWGVCMWCVCMHTCPALSFLPYSLEIVSLNLEIDWQPMNFSDPPVCCPQRCDSKPHTDFYVGALDVNSGPHACVAITPTMSHLPSIPQWFWMTIL